MQWYGQDIESRHQNALESSCSWDYLRIHRCPIPRIAYFARSIVATKIVIPIEPLFAPDREWESSQGSEEEEKGISSHDAKMEQEEKIKISRGVLVTDKCPLQVISSTDQP